MLTHRLQRKPKLSRNEALRLVIDMIQLSSCAINRERSVPLTNMDEVKAIFQAANYDFDAVVDECRDPTRPVPLFENLIGSTFFVFGGSEPPKTIINSHLLSAYETAEEQLERAIT